MTLHPQVELLASKLGAIEQILAGDPKTGWTAKIRQCRGAIEISDEWGLDRFLTFFGGMGSLNDYYIERDGKPQVEETDRLHALLSEAWTLAHDIRRS